MSRSARLSAERLFKESRPRSSYKVERVVWRMPAFVRVKSHLAALFPRRLYFLSGWPGEAGATGEKIRDNTGQHRSACLRWLVCGAVFLRAHARAHVVRLQNAGQQKERREVTIYSSSGEAPELLLE